MIILLEILLLILLTSVLGYWIWFLASIYKKEQKRRDRIIIEELIKIKGNSIEGNNQKARKRLTERGKTYCENDVFNNFDALHTYDYSSMIYSELAEYENFMEDNGFESIKDLKAHINAINEFKSNKRM